MTEGCSDGFLTVRPICIRGMRRAPFLKGFDGMVCRVVLSSRVDWSRERNAMSPETSDIKAETRVRWTVAESGACPSAAPWSSAIVRRHSVLDGLTISKG